MRDCTTHVLTHTLHYGLGCFEGVRAYQTVEGAAIFRLHDHTRRLFDSAKILGMNIQFSMEEIDAAQKAAVASNDLEHAYLRPMVFYGSEGMGLRADLLKTHVIVAAWAWGSYIEENLKRGLDPDFELHAPSCKYHDDKSKSEWELHELDACIARGANWRCR